MNLKYRYFTFDRKDGEIGFYDDALYIKINDNRCFVVNKNGTKNDHTLNYTIDECVGFVNGGDWKELDFKGLVLLVLKCKYIYKIKPFLRHFSMGC